MEISESSQALRLSSTTLASQPLTLGKSLNLSNLSVTLLDVLHSPVISENILKIRMIVIHFTK